MTVIFFNGISQTSSTHNIVKPSKLTRYSSMRRLLYNMSGDVKNFKCFFSKLYVLEDESTKFFQNTGKQLYSDANSYPRTTESPNINLHLQYFWIKLFCILQVDHDHCSPNPCENDAPCFNTQADYYCHCPEDWEGKNCSTPRLQCNSPPCEGIVT